MIAMRKVEASSVHSGIHHSLKLGNLPAGGSQGADNLGATILLDGGATNHAKSDETSCKSWDVGGVRDHGLITKEWSCLGVRRDQEERVTVRKRDR